MFFKSFERRSTVAVKKVENSQRADARDSRKPSRVKLVQGVWRKKEAKKWRCKEKRNKIEGRGFKGKDGYVDGREY